MVCPKNMNSIRGKRYRLRIETLIILTYIEKISGDQAMLLIAYGLDTEGIFFFSFCHLDDNRLFLH